MSRRRRRTDKLPAHDTLPQEAHARARSACEIIEKIGFDSTLVVHVPNDGKQAVVSGTDARTGSRVDIARSVATAVVNTGKPLELLDTRELLGLKRQRHAAIPVGATEDSVVVVVVSDANLARRDGEALATWLAPAQPASMPVNGGEKARLAREICAEFSGDALVIAVFTQVGMMLNLHVRSGALLHSWRVPSDTVWGEVARHGAAFTLGDLPIHSGCELLASVGMTHAGVVGLENGAGIAFGSIGVLSSVDQEIDIAQRLLLRSPEIGPQIMEAMSRTRVPVPAPDGSVDLAVLAARVGCSRFVVYRRARARSGEGKMRLAYAFDQEGRRIDSTPDPWEQRIVNHASEQRAAVGTEDGAAIMIGEDTLLYASDATRNSLERLRLALHDIRHNPFGEASDTTRDAA